MLDKLDNQVLIGGEKLPWMITEADEYDVGEPAAGRRGSAVRIVEGTVRRRSN